MSNDIKKMYKEIYSILEANSNRKVSTVLPQLVELMSAKTKSSTVRRDEEGNITHIFCYYHKEWEDVTTHEYGSKKHSSTGLNTMCKKGASNWSKQQRVAKQAKTKLLEQVALGEVAGDDVSALMDEIEANRTEIVPLTEGEA